MELNDMDFRGLGRFMPEKATFRIDTPNLPTGWDYIYQNRRILLRVDQRGPIYAQVNPPSDIMLFRREPFQTQSSWIVWLRSREFSCKAFTNFLRPVMGEADPAASADEFHVSYSPSLARYEVEQEGVRCVTDLCVPQGSASICMKVSLMNLRPRALEISAFPVLRPYVNPAMLAPWDRPEWYLKSGLCTSGQLGFWSHLLNMNSEADKRRFVALWSDKRNATRAEINYERFVGQGGFDNPESVFAGRLRLSTDKFSENSEKFEWGEYGESNSIMGYPPVYALQYDFRIAPGETASFRQAFTLLPPGPGGTLPKPAAARKTAVLIAETPCRAEQRKVARQYDRLLAGRTIRTADAALDRYVNEWLPLQMDWVCSLDRGWPSGMRGSRDSANDFTAMVPLDPDWAADILRTLFSCQRTDGWFPRQYSALGRKGKHDLRGHVDAGAWVIELLYEYLCYTKNLEIIKDRLAWLDRDAEDTVWDHVLRAMDYFIRPRSIGEHGLCKIGEGDWLDSVNRAGLEDRGESVTVTNQAIIGLTQMSEIVAKLRAIGRIPRKKADGLLKRYAGSKTRFLTALRAHAFNRKGYFNSVFNDAGRWLFSDRDPDGERRMYGPANWFSIASGAASDLILSVLKTLDFLKCEAGYRLYWPPMGKKPIEKIGRGGTGDQPEGLWENGNVYNQGSHGFLGRALAVAGEGDRLYEVLQYMLPYDQAKHPVEAVMTPPYAVVNCWQGVPGFRHRGGLVFLTGSIAYAMRMVYEWMFGIKPRLDGLAIDPCVPSGMKTLNAEFEYLGRKIRLEIRNPAGRQAGAKRMTLNGRKIETTIIDPFSGRTMFVAGDRLFRKGRKGKNELVVTL